jgi:hypothetical protein
MDDTIIDLFAQGVSDYQSGYLPDGWDDASQREESPYLTGWYMASRTEVGPDLDDRNT